MERFYLVLFSDALALLWRRKVDCLLSVCPNVTVARRHVVLGTITAWAAAEVPPTALAAARD
jgi:hypothetical protein